MASDWTTGGAFNPVFSLPGAPMSQTVQPSPDALGLTPEERHLIGQLVRSPGWRPFVEKIIVLKLKQASAHIDAPQGDEKTAQLFRGAKMLLKDLMTICYQCAGVTNPFEAHAAAFLLDLPATTVPPPTPQEETPPDVRRPARPAHPVL